MKKQRFIAMILLMIGVTIIGCAKSTENSKVIPTNNTDLVAKSVEPIQTSIQKTEKFNKFFSGTIGDEVGEKAKTFSFQMRLQRNGTDLKGKYRYSTSKSDIILNGTIDEANKFILEETVNGKVTGKFEGELEPETEETIKLFGVWTKAGSEEYIGFTANEIAIEFSSDVYFQTENIEERTKSRDLSIYYPQFVDGNFTKINSLIKNEALQYQRNFKKLQSERNQHYSIEAGFTIHFANENLVTIEFVDDSFSGGAHPNHATKTLNYDLKAEKIIKLTDLFKPNSKYLEKLTLLSKEKLADNLQFEEGINPETKNFVNFLITKKGLLFYFDEYQVAPYAAGRQEIVISFEELKDFLVKKDLLLIH